MAQKKSSKGSKKSSRRKAASDVPGAEPRSAAARTAVAPGEPIVAAAMPRIDAEANIRRDISGRARKIRGEFELPLPASSMRGATDEAAAPSMADSVKAFLQANVDQIGMPAANLELISEVDTAARKVVRFQRMHEGVPIVDSNVIVQIDDANRVRQIDLGDAPQVVAPPAISDEAPGRKLTPKQAMQAAMNAVGEGASLRMAADDPSPVYVPTNNGLRLGYLVVLPTAEPAPHDWRIIVDAYSGEVLQKRDLIAYIDGAGLVFDPNPVVTSGNSALRDPDATTATCGFSGTARATIDGQRVTRTLRDITLSSGTHKLEGPFVKIRNFGAPASTLPAEATAANFNYSSGDDRFEATNVYYHVDTAQRYIQSLGITTAHNKVIECDPHDNTNNAAWFSPADKGLHFSDSGPCRPDRGEDGHVMFHEYGHAIQYDQVPGWGGVNPGTGRDETGAMGEGFGDAFACIYFSGHGSGFMREVFEQWVFGDTAISGLRRVDGTKVYPTDWAGGVHANGEIWSSALWNIFRNIGGDSAVAAERQAARDALLETVILSHHLMAADGTMPDAAEAVMDTHAALDEYRGKHLIPMLNSFHDRGILRSNAGVDLYIRDATGDPGNDAFSGTFWNSPDLWIRNANDNGTVHQDPEAGQDNWFYARVRNRGTQPARAFVVTFNAKIWAGTEFVYPADFIPFISAGVGYDLAPGAEQIVKAKWPASLVPAAGSHVCWVSSVYTPVDLTPAGRNVWQHNNLAQKNLVVVDIVAGDTVAIPFQLGTLSRLKTESFTVELRRPRNLPNLNVSLTHSSRSALEQLFSRFDEGESEEASVPGSAKPIIRFLQPSRIEITHRAAGTDPLRLTLGTNSTLDLGELGLAADAAGPEVFDENVSQPDVIGDATTSAGAVAFRAGAVAAFLLTLRPRTPVTLNLKVTVPREARAGEVIQFDIVQRNKAGRIVGGIAYQVNVINR